MFSPFHILFTDLDGTLLDEKTYAYEPALSAIRTLQERGIPIVFCTSKTFQEVRHIQHIMGISDPCIVENGGAVYYQARTRSKAWKRISLGVPYKELVSYLAKIKRMVSCPVQGFSDMAVEEIAKDCGLSLDEARRAKQREYDEPFKLHSPSQDDLERIAELTKEWNLIWTQGGRYHHICGRSDKGLAVRRLSELVEKRVGPIRTVGVGDSPNDLPMLKSVNVPVIVMRPDGSYNPRLLEGLPSAIRAPGIGPQGWNAAVLDLMAEEAVHEE
jgi:mannosyl-3-phosphoglycerate phosphatase